MPEKMTLPVRPEEITAGWLTAALRRNGVPGEPVVTSVTATRIGADEGFTGGALLHLSLAYASDTPDAPQSMVAKLAPSDPEFRLAMKLLNIREADFYRGFGSAGDLPVPRCYYADYDAESGACILLLEDLGTYRLVPFIVGCNRQECEQVIRLLAQIHARWWNHRDLEAIGGTDLGKAYPFDTLWRQYPDKVAALLPDMAIPDWFIAFGDTVAARGAAVEAALYESTPFTLLHRDVQPDNLMFPDATGDGQAMLIDWQLACCGRPTFDAGFFLVTSTQPELRRQIEQEMIALYHHLLIAHGVEGYGFAQCWTDYRFGALGRLSNDVGATVLLDNESPHRKAWRRAALTRLLAFLEDHPLAEMVAQL